MNAEERNGRLVALFAQCRAVERLLDRAEQAEDLAGRVRHGARLRELTAAIVAAQWGGNRGSEDR